MKRDDSGGAVWEVVVAILMVLVAAVAFAQQADKGKDKDKDHGPKRVIHGKPADRHAVEMLMDDSDGDVEVNMYIDNKTVKMVKGKFKIDKNKPVEEAAIDLIDRHRNAFGLKNPKEELKVSLKNVDKKGNTHFRLQQMYNSVPVWGEEFLVHINKDQEVYIMQPNKITTPDLDTIPLVTAEEALQIVQKSILDKGGELGTNVERPITTLIILPYGVQQYLCYTITISTNKPSGSWRYFVDARTGKILQREDMIDRDSPVRGTGVYWNNTPVDIGLYEEKGNIYLAHGYDPDAQLGAGFVFNNDTSPFPNYSSTLTRFKRNRSISAWDAHTSIYFKNAFLMRDPNNDGHIAGDEGITPGVNILANHSTAYGYFSRNFGWQPVWSNTGASSLVGVAHMGDNTNNSEWDKVNYRVKYGVGEPDETSSLENAAHEIGHAVTQSKIPPDGFKISGQSGSIGEHVSDLWATMLSRDGDYLLFNDRLGSKADRDFSNPASDNPIMWNNVSELQSHPLPVNMRDFLYTSLDQFGRHQNLGILDVRLGKVEPKLTKV